MEAVNCGTDFSEDLQVRRAVHECVAGKLEIVPLRAQLPFDSSNLACLLHCSAEESQEERKLKEKKKHIYMSGCPEVLLLKSSQ